MRYQPSKETMAKLWGGNGPDVQALPKTATAPVFLRILPNRGLEALVLVDEGGRVLEGQVASVLSVNDDITTVMVEFQVGYQVAYEGQPFPVPTYEPELVAAFKAWGAMSEDNRARFKTALGLDAAT